MDKFILFDVGANWGEDSLPHAAQNKNVEVFAFEPTPIIASFLKQASINFTQRYHVHEVAVSDFDGDAEFFIQNNPGMGCNSLNHFDQEMITAHWEKRNVELSATHSIPVKVITLKTWFQAHPEITKIDHFHCDTQGNDLKVLRGMGEYIEIIKTGKVEVAQPHIKLYKESPSAGEVLDFLLLNNFKITKIESNDHLANEYNIYFESKK
jgi:FkbM family methyltransferase